MGGFQGCSRDKHVIIGTVCVLCKDAPKGGGGLYPFGCQWGGRFSLAVPVPTTPPFGVSSPRLGGVFLHFLFSTTKLVVKVYACICATIWELVFNNWC